MQMRGFENDGFTLCSAFLVIRVLDNTVKNTEFCHSPSYPRIASQPATIDYPAMTIDAYRFHISSRDTVTSPSEKRVTWTEKLEKSIEKIEFVVRCVKDDLQFYWKLIDTENCFSDLNESFVEILHWNWYL